MEQGKTQRGFRYANFEDRCGSRCSLQMSILATEAAIWLGVDVDFNGKESARMHLTRPMVAQLLPLLQHFVSTGDLPSADSAPIEPDTAQLIRENQQLQAAIDAIRDALGDALDELNSTSRT